MNVKLGVYYDIALLIAYALGVSATDDPSLAGADSHARIHDVDVRITQV